MLLRERIQRLDESQTNIAKIAGVSDATISRFLKGDQIGFYPALKIVKKYWPDHEKELIYDLCSYLKLQSEREALEYAFISGNVELTKMLISKLKQSNNRHDVKWAKLYEIEYLRNNESIELSQLLELINRSTSASLETIEMKIYHAILKSYVYYDLKEFDVTRSFLVEHNNRADQISSDFIKLSYKTRIAQVMSAIYLQKNDLESCRKFTEVVFSSTDSSPLTAAVYHTLGNSYMFEDAELSLKYLEIAREMYISRKRFKGQRRVESSINFVKNLYNMEPDYLQLSNDVRDLHSNAFYYIKKGNVEKAQSFLDKVEIQNLTNFNKAFHFYYRAEISRNEEQYLDSIQFFKKSGDLFYISLPIEGLRKVGYSEKLLTTLSI